MSKFHKDIDELLSCYIDGELSERECTEVKRLMQHDKRIAGRLSSLRKQKQLLNNLPVALTAAAMFMLVAILAVVVFNVLMPDAGLREPVAIQPADSLQDAGGNKEAFAESTAVEPDATPDYYPFRAALELASYDSIAVNGFIAKAIYSNGLVDNTIPERQPTLSTYHITCTTAQIVTLLTDLEAVWDKCGKTSLTIYAEDQDSEIMINNITSSQAIAVFAEYKPNERTELAQNYADFNALIQDSGAGSDFALSRDEEQFVPSVPIKPELTRPEPPVRQDQPQTSQSVNLIITVTGL